MRAKNVLDIAFNDVIEKNRGFRRAEIIIRFCYYNAEGKKVKVKSMKASALYRDWYGECIVCPPNDARISQLHILVNPICTALDIKEDVTFEQLMNVLEEVTVGHARN